MRDMRTSPDCHEGKHHACDGVGYDIEADHTVRCSCSCHAERVRAVAEEILREDAEVFRRLADA